MEWRSFRFVPDLALEIDNRRPLVDFPDHLPRISRTGRRRFRWSSSSADQAVYGCCSPRMRNRLTPASAVAPQSGRASISAGSAEHLNPSARRP